MITTLNANDLFMVPILNVKDLEQQLFDPDRGDRFTVNVDESICLKAGDFASSLNSLFADSGILPRTL